MQELTVEWNLTWYELAEMAWWEQNPTATQQDFEREFYTS
jgi:hypothetical protein